MNLSGEGVIVHARALEGNTYLITLFTGVCGLVRGAVKVSDKHKADVQLGNHVKYEQFKRLDTQLGKLSLEVFNTFIMHAFLDEHRLNALHAVCDTLYTAIQEGEPQEHLYHATLAFLHDLPEKGLWRRLSFWELHLIHALGYGVHLEPEMAVRGEEDFSPLLYLSPKSGRMVSARMGEPYKDKLLKLPAVFGGESEDFLDVFHLTGHFLNRALENKPLTSRSYLIEIARKTSFNDVVS